MRAMRNRWRAGACVMAIVLVGGACGDDSDDAAPSDDEVDDTTIVVGAEELPDILNMVLFDGATSWTAWTTGPVHARGYRVLPDFTYEPWLFEDDCTVESDDPFTVSCTIRSDATWSDGTDITADDFRFTYETMIDEANDVWSTLGYENVDAFDVDDDKMFTVTFAEPYPAFRELWASGTIVLPEHLLDGEDFNTVWNDCICDPESGEPVGSGPYLVESFDAEERLALVRNERYWDGDAKTDRIVFVSTPETDTQVNALTTGEVDLVYPQESIDVRQRLDAVDGSVLETGVGLALEQLSLLTTTPGLDDVEVRRAIATALPRAEVVSTVAQPVSEDVVVLDNSIYVTSQDEYVPNWDIHPASGDLEEAARILDAAGWTREGDGVRTRDDVELRFPFGTTAGEQGRELTQQIIQDRLGEIGIVLEIENTVDFFDRLDAFEYPVALYGWDTTPDPAWAAEIYGTDEPLNVTLQSNEQVDALLAQAATTIDPDARAALLNAADRVMAEEVISVIPLYQKPALLAYAETLAGPVVNVSLEGFTWNIEDWERTG